MKIAQKAAVLSALLFPLAASSVRAEDAARPIAKIGSTVLTEADMRKDIGMQLYQVENQLYNVEKTWIDQQAMDMLFDQAAKAAGLSRVKWEAREIDAKVPAPEEAQVKQMATQMARPGSSAEEAQKNAREYMNSQMKQSRRFQVFQELAKATPVEILVVKPVTPRIQVAYSNDDPMRGDPKASVTIVEFTDFQCPYCSRSQATLKQVEEAYPKDVKLVTRAYPLPFHDRAKPAAEAAFCAKEQGKYWEYRDKLFSNQQGLGDADLRRYAQELSLNAKKFDKCLTDHRYAAKVDSDMKEGQKYGVTGTPAFFVNGEMIVGAQPFPQFQQAVQNALAQKK